MIDRNSTLLDITEKFPETIPVFTSNGFPQMADPQRRRTFAGTISLSNALLLKQIDSDAFVHLLEESIHSGRESSDITLLPRDNSDPEGALRVVGLLPCPVRLPLLEKWNDFLKAHNESGGRRVKHELKAASMGLEWIQNNISGVTDVKDLPDLFISAGFEMFFDRDRFGRFRKEGVFSDLSGYSDFNSDFNGLDLKDPEGAYSVIAVVAAVFLVNMDELGGRPIPATWKDILSPEYEGCVSLPVGDFDLFNSIMLNIHKNYGDEGIRALGRCLLESMHPSQMVKSERLKQSRPAITIMPYFFTKMVKEGSSMRAVWPSDGAIISPIFMLAKKAEQVTLQPVIDFFASAAAGNILARQGLFPSTHPDVNNLLSETQKFMWLGWDYINSNDLSALIHHCEDLFHSSSRRSGAAIEAAS
jgi:ABC-type Fe3+ transport system substrate-binding protein